MYGQVLHVDVVGRVELERSRLADALFDGTIEEGDALGAFADERNVRGVEFRELVGIAGERAEVVFAVGEEDDEMRTFACFCCGRCGLGSLEIPIDSDNEIKTVLGNGECHAGKG